MKTHAALRLRHQPAYAQDAAHGPDLLRFVLGAVFDIDSEMKKLLGSGPQAALSKL
jgi:hypothetical protein